jgi:hypothetical protein
MEEKIPVYSVCQDGDVYGISLVDKPANGFMFVALSEVSKIVNLSADDKKKRILYSIVLRPDQLIYREDENGNPFNLTFDEETVEYYSQEFLKNGFTNNSKYNHQGEWLKDVSIVENWIVKDGDNDKANAVGLSVKEGDWVAGIKVSQKVWDDFVETGKVKGFSIDSFISFEKINMAKHLPSVKSVKKLRPNMSIFKKVMKFLAEDESVPGVQSFETDKGVIYAEKLDLGYLVVDADGMPLVGEFVFEDNKYTTDAEGVIIAIDPVEADNADAQAEADKAKEAEQAQAVQQSQELSETKKANVDLAEEIKVLKAAVALLKQEAIDSKLEKEALNAENIKLKAQPVTEKLKGALVDQNVNKTKDTQLSAIENLVNKNKK